MTQPDRVAQVVAWLRAQAALHFLQDADDEGIALNDAADAIEAGEPFKETPDA